jgi:hypothetical protein
MLSTALSKIVAAKAVATVVLLAGATGGVALAATVSGGPDAPPADRPAATRTSAPAAAPADDSAGRAQSGADATEEATTEAPAAPAEPDPSLTGLCHAWTAGATDNPGAAADNPAFGALVEAAGSRDEVDGYCADLEDGEERGPDGDRPAGPPADAPGAAAERSGPPTAAPGNPDHPAGPPADVPGQGAGGEHGRSASDSPASPGRGGGDA